MITVTESSYVVASETKPDGTKEGQELDIFFYPPRSTPMKALGLIQIEERAISELAKAYSAAENPDEFIVVKRCPPRQHQQNGRVANTRWSRKELKL